MKRTLKIAGIAAGALVLLLGLALGAVLLLVDLDKLVNEQLAVHKPDLEARLGRKVELGTVSTRLFPTVRVELSNLSIAAAPDRPEQEGPLLAIGSARVDVSLWSALLTGGEQIAVNELVVTGLRVNLVRHADGTLGYQDILDRQPAEEPEEPTPPSPELQQRLRNLSIGEIRLEDAELRLVDYATPTGKPAESFVRRLDLRVSGVRVERPVQVALGAAIFSDQKNFELTAELSPVGADLKVAGPLPLRGLKLRASSVDLSRLAPYVPSGAVASVESALASADLALEAHEGPASLKGFLEVKQLRLAEGERFDVRLDTDLTADLAKLGVDIARLDLKVGEVELTMSGALQDLSTAPKFKDFTVRSKSLSPGALLSYYPAARKDLPPGTRLSGAALLEAVASGDASRQTVSARLDLGPLDVFYPGALVKPAGVPMALEVKGDFSPADARLERLSARLDELELLLRGTVKDFDRPAFDLTASARPFTVDRLVRLLPSVREGLEAKRASASGRGQLSGHLKGTQANLDAALDFSLAGVKLDVPGTKLDGDLALVARAKGDPSKSLEASLVFDANQALIQLEELMNKGVKTPLRLEVDLKRTPERLDVRRFDLRLAELGLGVKGGIDYPKSAVDVRVDLSRLDLEKFSRTVTAIPAAYAKNGFLTFRLAVRGDPNRMETIELSLSGLDARLGQSDLRGEARLRNPKSPDVTMKASARMLDLDELFPEDDEPKEQKARADRPYLKDLRFAGSFDAERVRYEGAELRDFKCAMRLEDGTLRLDDCAFVAYGGRVDAKGTELEAWRGKPAFKAKVNVKDLDVGAALTEQTRFKNVLVGKGDLSLDLSGKGYDTIDLEQFLSGDVALGMKQGRFGRASVLESVTGKLDALKQVPGVSMKAMAGQNEFRELAARLEVKDGKLRLLEPVTLPLDQARASLGGAIGIGGKLFLEGTYFLPGAAVSSLTQGRCKADGELAIPLEIAGSIDGPEYRPQVAGIAASLVKACLASAATGAVASQVKAATGLDVPTSADEAKRKAEEEAQKQAEAARQAAEAKAKEEAERVRAEAERRAAEERKRAEEAAKKKAGELLKGFGVP